MDIDKTAKSNKLLSTPENLVVYMTLFQAHSDSKKLKINEIEKAIKNEYNQELDRNKIWRVLQLLMDNEVIHKKIHLNSKNDEYYLTNVIYSPIFYTPIPIYQILLLGLITTITGYLYLFSDSMMLTLISLNSLATIALTMVLHYISFNIIKLNYNESYLKRNKVINKSLIFIYELKRKCTTYINEKDNTEAMKQ